MKLSTAPGLNVGNKNPVFQKSNETGATVAKILSIDDLRAGTKITFTLNEKNVEIFKGIMLSRGITNPLELFQFFLQEEAIRLMTLQWQRGERDLTETLMAELSEKLDDNMDYVAQFFDEETLRRIFADKGINDELGIRRSIEAMQAYKRALQQLGFDF